MAVTVVDSFTAADNTLLTNHVGDSGHSWGKSQSADLLIVGNRLVGVSGNIGNNRHYTSRVTATPQYAVSVRVTKIADDAGSIAAFRARSSLFSAPWGYEIEVSYNGPVTVWFKRWNPDGSLTVLGSYSLGTVAVGTSVEVKLSALNAEKAVFIDGIKRISSTDNSIPGEGRAGVSFYKNGFALDNFTIDEVASVSSSFDTAANITNLRKLWLHNTLAVLGQSVSGIFDTRADLYPGGIVFFHPSGYAVFSRAPLRPERSLDLLQPARRSAAGFPFGFDPHAVERPLTLTWPGLTKTEVEALETFFFDIARGMAETFLYKDAAGATRTVRFALPELEVSERAPGRYAVTCYLLEEP